MRRWLNQNPVAASVLILGFIIFWVVVLVVRMNSDDGERALAPVEFYFYDIETGELFAGPSNVSGPIDAPSGEGNGYKAYVFTCGDCNDETQRKVYWIEKPMSFEEDEEPPDEGEVYFWVRTPDMPKDDWVRSDSPRGEAIFRLAEAPCPEKKQRLNHCFPPRRYLDD